MKVSERRICRVLGQHRSTQRRHPRGRVDEDQLVADMIELARQYGRYGYRRVAVLLRDAGWHVSDGRIERLRRREGLKVPPKQPKKGRLWLNDRACIRQRPEYCNHVWSYDFVHCRTDDGKAFRTLNILDEFSRECPPLGDCGAIACRSTDDPGEAEAELDRCHRCADQLVHPARATRIHS